MEPCLLQYAEDHGAILGQITLIHLFLMLLLWDDPFRSASSDKESLSVRDCCGRAGWRLQCTLGLPRRRHLRGTAPPACRLWVSSLSAAIREVKRATHNHPVVAACGEEYCIRVHQSCERFLITDDRSVEATMSSDLRSGSDESPLVAAERTCSARPKKDD